MQTATRKMIAKLAIKILPQDSWLYKHSMNVFFRTTYKFRMRHQKSIAFEFPITDKCNLNCVSCITYAPLIPGKEPLLKYDINSFRNDLEQLKQIDSKQNRISTINLTGGEALLNPNIEEYIKCARSNFPNSTLRIRTNGCLISKMPKPFWDICKGNNVELAITEYPLTHIKNAKDIIRDHGIKVHTSVYNGNIKKMFAWPLTTKGDQKDSHKICPQANNGYLWIVNGKAYKCAANCFVYILNQHFGLNFQTTDQDTLDIHKITNTNDIIDFATKPIPFCKYCDYKKARYGMNWTKSKQILSEWVL